MADFIGAPILVLALENPAPPTLEVRGTPGETTYGYKVVGYREGDHTAASAEATVDTGPLSLSIANSVLITPPLVAHVVTWDVYRTTGGTTQGYIGQLTPSIVNDVQIAGFLDYGIVAEPGDPPDTNTSGQLYVTPVVDKGIFYAGADGQVIVLPPADDGTVLTMVEGTPTWNTGFTGGANPMTTMGDLIRAGDEGTPERLGVGTDAQVLTMVDGVPTWADVPGTSVVHRAHILLDHGQIAALPTVPVEVVPAPGEGHQLYVLSAVIALDTSSGAYGNFDPDVTLSVALVYAGADWPFNWATAPYDEQSQGAFGDASRKFLAPFFPLGTSTGTPGWWQSGATPENAALQLAAFNGLAGNLDGGHLDNTLTLTVYYVDLAEVEAPHGSGGGGGGGEDVGFDNPMSALGDLIRGGVAGVAVRLPAGDDAQVLTMVEGLPAWADLVDVGFVNPMTTLGDLIVGGAVGAPQRLAHGSNGQILTIVSNVPAWATPNDVGFVNPMTTLGDLIVGGSSGVATRLGIGDADEVLTVVAGVPAWAPAAGGTPPSGANPSASVGLSAVNGSASTFLRSDGAPALSQSIAPTWTGVHTFANQIVQNYSITNPLTGWSGTHLALNPTMTADASGSRAGYTLDLNLAGNFDQGSWYGFIFEPGYSGTGSFSTFTCMMLAPSIEPDGGTFDTYIVLDLSASSGASATDKYGIRLGSLGPATHAYNLYIADPGGGVAADNYGIYVAGGRAYFGDIVRLIAGNYINFGATGGSAGYGIRDNGGTIEAKNSGGAWTAIL